MTIKITFYLLLLLSSFTLSALEEGIAQEDVQKILKHLQMNYRIPSEVHNDSISRINYNVFFVINEEGRITDPKILSKTAECDACERELLKVLKRTPAVTPIYIDDKKVKVQYQLPFNIQLQ